MQESRKLKKRRKETSATVLLTKRRRKKFRDDNEEPEGNPQIRPCETLPMVLGQKRDDERLDNETKRLSDEDYYALSLYAKPEPYLDGTEPTLDDPFLFLPNQLNINDCSSETFLCPRPKLQIILKPKLGKKFDDIDKDRKKQIGHLKFRKKNLLKSLIRMYVKTITKLQSNMEILMICDQHSISPHFFGEFLKELHNLKAYGLSNMRKLWSGSKMTLDSQDFFSPNRVNLFQSCQRDLGEVMLKTTKLFFKRYAITAFIHGPSQTHREALASIQYLHSSLNNLNEWCSLQFLASFDPMRSSLYSIKAL